MEKINVEALNRELPKGYKAEESYSKAHDLLEAGFISDTSDYEVIEIQDAQLGDPKPRIFGEIVRDKQAVYKDYCFHAEDNNIYYSPDSLSVYIEVLNIVKRFMEEAK